MFDYLASNTEHFRDVFSSCAKHSGEKAKSLIFYMTKTHIMIILEALVSQANHVSLGFYIFEMSPER